MNSSMNMTTPTPQTTSTPRVRIAIVFHSGYGHTARQAQAVKEGVAQVEGTESPSS